MTTWILMGVGVYLLGLFLPSLFLIPQIGLTQYAGSRDQEPEPNAVRGRAMRAHRNMLESLPLFLTFGVLSLVVPTADANAAVLGAQIFVLARLVYLPLYLMAAPFVRSGVWTVGFVGLLIMAEALI